MYISKIELQKDIPSSRVRQLHFRSYQPHREIWRMMSGGRQMQRNFVYRLDTDSGTPVWHVVSEQPPDDDLGVWNITTKAYNPVLTSGMRLSFSLRANPVKTQSENKKKRRFDVVIDARYHLKEKGIPKEEWPSAEQLTLQHSLAWLQKRTESFGFAIEETGDGYSSVLVERHEQQRFRKEKEQRDVTLSVVDYRGVLSITNAELFREKLFCGIGHGKAFGCGLMLVRRV